MIWIEKSNRLRRRVEDLMVTFVHLKRKLLPYTSSGYGTCTKMLVHVIDVIMCSQSSWKCHSDDLGSFHVPLTGSRKYQMATPLKGTDYANH